MRAVRIHAQGDLRVEDVEAPQAAPGTVLLESGYTGICGSDLHLYYAPEAFPWNFSEPAELTGGMWPQILGHEFSGRVSAVGADVEGIEVGDDVAVFPFHYCGECEACRAGKPNLCPKMAFEGIQGVSGGMAEVKVVDAAACLVLPDGVDLRLGALVEPMSVAWHGVGMALATNRPMVGADRNASAPSTGRPDENDAAIVVGAGPIGVGAYFALTAAGFGTIVVSEPSAARRATMTALGAEHVVDPTEVNLDEYVRELTGGRGAQCAIDCAGAPGAVPGAAAALGIEGRYVIVAAFEKPIDFGTTLVSGDKTFRSSAVYTRDDFEAVIAAMGRGLYRTDAGWIETVQFDEVEDAIARLRTGQGMKILVETPTA